MQPERPAKTLESDDRWEHFDESPMLAALRHSATSEVAETKSSIPERRARDARYAEHVDHFDAALKSKASDHFASLTRASLTIEFTFDDPSSSAWSELRSAIDLERALVEREHDLMFALWAATPIPRSGLSAPPDKAMRAQLEDALDETRRARVELRTANPALAFVDSRSIDRTQTNEELSEELHRGAREVRAAIADVSARINDGDIDLRKLDRLVARVLEEQKISPEHAASGDERSRAILEDLEHRAENRALFVAGTIAASLLFTVGTFGTGSAALGLVGAGFNFGVAAIDFEAADDLHDIGNANLGDADALVDPQAARQHYATALANVVLASVDLVLSAKAIRVSHVVRQFKSAPIDHIPETGLRNTLGRSGVPTATPTAAEPHLGAIHRGLERMPSHVRRKLDDLVQGGEVGRQLRDEMSAIDGRLAALYAERAVVAKRASGLGDDAARAQAELTAIDARAGELGTHYAQFEKQLHAAEKAGATQAEAVMDYFLKSIRRPVDAAKLAAQVKIEPLALEKVAAQLQATRAEAAKLSGKPLLEYAERELRAWLTDFLKVADPRMEPSALRLFYDVAAKGPRAQYRHGTGIHVGDKFSRKRLFHEAAHAIEYVDPSVSHATKAWRGARAQGVDGSMKLEALDKLAPGTGYGAKEKAVAVHDFHDDYVGKVYDPSDPATEVMTMFVQELNNPAAAVVLYRVDPELFFLGLGLLQR